MFTALIVEADTLIPKLMPQAIKSIETTHGDGGPGTIKTLTLAEGAQFKNLKHRVEAIDKENMTYSYSMLEGEALMDKVESIIYEIKFEPSSDGGCKVTTVSKYILKPGIEIPEEEIKAGKANGMAVFKEATAKTLKVYHFCRSLPLRHLNPIELELGIRFPATNTQQLSKGLLLDFWGGADSVSDGQDEQIPPLLSKEQPKNKWDDEDVDDEDVKESWEDEDEPAPAPPPATKPPPEKTPKKPVSKAPEKKGKTVEAEKEEPLDPVAEKLRQQRLVEEADYKSTTELFAKKGGDDKTLDNFIPKSESDFMEYAELISNKLRPYEKSYHYIALLKAVMRLSMTALKAADAKEVASSVTAIANEKLKAEKEATSKKKVAKKKQLHVEKPDDDLAANTYEDYDDYDFM
ncbi:hypothetical protein SLA2020_072160 [Shorea laevis]